MTYADVCLKPGVELTVDDPIMATQKQVHRNKYPEASTSAQIAAIPVYILVKRIAMRAESETTPSNYYAEAGT